MAVVPSRTAIAVASPKPGAGWRSMDLGRLVMVPIAVLVLVADLEALIGRDAPSSAVGALRLLNAVLTCAFYALILWSYLRRGPAVATSGSKLAAVVAVVATFAPFPFPLLHGTPAEVPRQLAADLLLVAGTAWSVWSLRYLGRNLSVIAQARGVADRGPYRLVRHPLYTGEMMSALGLAVAAGTIPAFAVWLVFVAMQAYRARQEEKVLRDALPAYGDYRARTAALVPWLL